jgi:putative transposase
MGSGDRGVTSQRTVAWIAAADIHDGRAEGIRQHRAQVLDAAYAAHPERFVRKAPTPPELPGVVWINQPEEATTTTQ